MAGIKIQIRELLTPEQAADMLRVQVRTLNRWDRKGWWPAGSVTRTLGGHRRYDAGVVRGIASGTLQLGSKLNPTGMEGN